MPVPILNPVAEKLYAKLEPIARRDEETGYSLAHWLNAWTQHLNELGLLVRDTADGFPGWSRILNPATAPEDALDYLAQFIGSRVLKGESAASKREKIAAGYGLRRGSPAAIAAAVQPLLTGNKTVVILERTTSAWTFTVVTRKIETPEFASDITLPNFSFETDTAGWAHAVTGATPTSFSRQAFTWAGSDGSYALRMDVTGAVAGNYQRAEMSTRAAVRALRTYRARHSTRNVGPVGEPAMTVHLALAWYDAAGNFISETAGPAQSTGGPSVVDCEVVGQAPPNAKDVSIRAYQTAQGSGPMGLYVDNFRLQELYSPVYDAILSQKPAGLVASHVVSDTPIIDEATLTIDGAAAGVDINAVVFGDV